MTGTTFGLQVFLALVALATKCGAGEPMAKPPAATSVGVAIDPGARKDPAKEAIVRYLELRNGETTEVGFVRMKGANVSGQATGISAKVTARCLDFGGQHGPNGDCDPPGWAYDRGMTRMTLFPYRMGGYGYFKQNLIAVYRRTVVPKFDAVVDRLYAGMKDGAVVEFSVTPVYRDLGHPTEIVIRASINLTNDGAKEVRIANEPPVDSDLPSRKPGELAEVARLRSLLRPPNSPETGEAKSSWADTEKRLGFLFPDDYKQFVATYGDGAIGSKGFGEFFRISTPFSMRESSKFEAVMKAYLDLYREEHRRDPVASPHPAWPTTGGLLPFGSTSNGDVLYWRTQGESARWTVVIKERGGKRYIDCGCNLATFLRRAIDEEFQAGFLLPSYLRMPVFDAVSRERLP